MTFGGLCFAETKEKGAVRKLVFACTCTSLHSGWVGCRAVYICKCSAQITRRRTHRVAAGMLSACAASPVTADTTAPLYPAKHKRHQHTTVWKILSFHFQIQLTLRASFPIDSQHDATTPALRMTDYFSSGYFQQHFKTRVRACARRPASHPLSPFTPELKCTCYDVISKTLAVDNKTN